MDSYVILFRVVIPAEAGIQDFSWWVLDSRIHACALKRSGAQVRE